MNTHVFPTNVYTSPVGKKTIIKSITINNNSSTDQSFTIRMAGYSIVYNHVIKPNDTIILPASGFVLLSNETLSVGNSSSLYIRVTGEVIDTSILLSPIVILRSTALTTSATGTQYRNTSNDVLIKSVSLCNITASPVAVSFYMGGFGIISAKMINRYDTLTIPFLDQLLIKGDYVQAWAGVEGAIVPYVTGIEVVNNA